MFQAIITCSFSSVVILADRSPDLSNRFRGGGISFSNLGRGGGISFLVNHGWCSEAEVLFTSCSPKPETLTVRCEPYYSPREFSSVIYE